MMFHSGSCIAKIIKIVIINYFVFIFVAARGFGMRVVGGKTGADGRLFAYIVWTVPGGPAEKGGLLNGDKVWNFYIISVYS